MNRVDTITADGGGGTGIDAVNVFGTDAANDFTVQYDSPLAGSVSVDSFPAVNYSNLGSGSTINLTSDNGGLGNPDSVRFIGTPVADTYTYTPTSANAATPPLTLRRCAPCRA